MNREKRSGIFTIVIREELDTTFSEWFEDFTLHTSNGCSTLTGEIEDQSALFGAIIKIRDLGLHLVSIQEKED